MKFNFDFIVNYEPNYAVIKLSGDIMFMEDEGKAKDIIDKWKKDKMTSGELSVHINEYDQGPSKWMMSFYNDMDDEFL